MHLFLCLCTVYVKIFNSSDNPIVVLFNISIVQDKTLPYLKILSRPFQCIFLYLTIKMRYFYTSTQARFNLLIAFILFSFPSIESHHLMEGSSLFTLPLTSVKTKLYMTNYLITKVNWLLIVCGFLYEELINDFLQQSNRNMEKRIYHHFASFQIEKLYAFTRTFPSHKVIYLRMNM